jgi:hypothetical protein
VNDEVRAMMVSASGDFGVKRIVEVAVVLLETAKCWSLCTDGGQSCFGYDEASTDNSGEIGDQLDRHFMAREERRMPTRVLKSGAGRNGLRSGIQESEMLYLSRVLARMESFESDCANVARCKTGEFALAWC